MSIIQSIIGTNLTIGGGGPPPSINIYGWSNPMGEGNTNTAYVDYINYPGTTLYWAIDNFASVSDADWQGGVRPSGSFFIQGTGSTSFSWTTAADLTTEGGEGYVLTVGTTLGGNDIVNQYLTIEDTSITPPPPQADFTIEWWDKTESGDSYPRPWAVGLWPNHSLAISYEGGEDLYWMATAIIGRANQTRISQGWRHNAYVRYNGVVKGYINGQEYFSTNDGNRAVTDTTQPLYIGTGGANGDYTGYIKDLHIIKGVAKYTGNFSVPYSPVTAQTGSVFLLPAISDGTKYNDTVGSKSGSVTGTVTYSEDDPWTYPGATFTAIGYGNNLITPSPMPANLRTGLKVSDGQGWSDYIINPNYFGNIQLLSLPASTPPELVYTVSEETSPLTISINYGGSGGGVATIEGRFSQYPASVALSAVRAGWTYLDPNGGTGTITSNAYISGSSVFLNVPESILGTWTFTPPNYGGSLYFNGSSYLNYGGSSDWAMDV